MFISYIDGLMGLKIKDTEFEIEIDKYDNSGMHFDAFALYYKSINKLTPENIIRFVIFYAEYFRKQEFDLALHKDLLKRCDFYEKYAEKIEKYLLWC